MNTPIPPVVLLDAVRRTKLQRAAEGSLIDFAKQAWHVLEPTTDLKWGWALDAICDHLMAVTDGDITRLLMNVPPGSMKSLLTSVFWPAWEWGPQQLTGMRYLSTAHKQDLAVRDNMKCRRLIQSTWYQERWPIKLVGDQNAKTKFENASTGFREAMSFTGMTGSRGDRVILDDPLSVDAAKSDAELSAAESTFREALPTRVNNDKSAIVVIMQRLHERDTSGIILKEKLGYEHLCIPMRYEKARRCHTTIGFTDPRKEDGELFFPERFPEKSVVLLEKTLGEYGAAGQLQQRPSPPGGGILKVAHFQLWPKAWEVPRFEYVVQSYDCAFTEKTSGDPTACTVWGVFNERGKRGAMLLDAWSEHMGYPKMRKKVIDDWHAVYGKHEQSKGAKADIVLVEKKASGQSLLQDLRAANIPAMPYDPGSVDKPNRAHQVAPILELDCLYIPESSKEPGEFVVWARPFVLECEQFPNAEHDDYVDTFTQAMILLRDQGRFELLFAEDEPIEETDYSNTRRGNPYAA